MEKMRVYWIPQLGVCEPFYVPVKNVEEGKKVMTILSAYDLFQLQNKIKPDFSNTGGLEVYNSETGEYEDWYLETETAYFEDIDEYLSTTKNSEEINNFVNEMFNQINWSSIEKMVE